MSLPAQNARPDPPCRITQRSEASDARFASASLSARNRPFVTRFSGPPASPSSATDCLRTTSTPGIVAATGVGRVPSLVIIASVRALQSKARAWQLFARAGSADAMQHAHALELAVNAVDIRAELRRIAQHDGARTRQIDADLVDHFAGARAHH